jgi:ankyrin repeat protein
VKDNHDDEVPDWVEADEVSDYHTFTVPYGPKFHARKIERLLYAKDLLLNAEWNRPKERETALHRHPAFFGNATDVIGDCCGYCPKPTTPEDEEIAEAENKIYVSGDLAFIKDDPGRQTIGSFHPLTNDDWTEMAYVGNTARLCQAIVDGDVEHVQDWLSQEGADPNERDYTGRTPLQLAVMSSPVEIVQILIDAGARIVARMVDGRTALHLAAMRGEAAMVKALLVKSEANEEKETEKEEARIKKRKDMQEIDDPASTADSRMADAEAMSDKTESDEDIDMLDDDEDEHADATTEGSIIHVSNKPQQEGNVAVDEDEDEPDVYDVNVLAWDVPVSPLHLAITNGHVEVVKLLVEEFGADVLLPVKLIHEHSKQPRAAILPLVLALQLAPQQADEMAKVLINLGASPAQADVENITALHYFAAKNARLLAIVISANQPAAKRAVDHLQMSGSQYNPTAKSALQSAIEHEEIESIDALLELGVQPQIDFAAYISSYKTKWEARGMSEHNQKMFQTGVQQPVLTAVEHELPSVVVKLLDVGADINSLSQDAWRSLHYGRYSGYGNVHTLLDATRSKVKTLHDWIEKEQREKAEITSGVRSGRGYTFAPVPLKDDAHYLNDLQAGTYAHWSTLKQLQAAKRKYDEDLKTYEDAVKATPKEADGWTEKMTEVESLLSKFEALESNLLERGAKTFEELHPDIKIDTHQSYRSHDYKPDPPKPWSPGLSFNLPDLTDEQRDAYIKLFQACWDADLSTVKELTLAVWGEKQTPLKMAVQDSSGFSPFSIAVLREHFDLAKALLEIAHIQYAPEKKPGQSKYSVQLAEDSDDEGTSNDEKDDVRIFHETVDDQFTVENIGEVQSQVKSKVTALAMLAWHCPVSRFLEEDDVSNSILDYTNYYGNSRNPRFKSRGGRAPRKLLKDAANGRTYYVNQQPSHESYQHVAKPGNLFQLAIYLDDADLLQFLIDAGEDFTVRRKSIDDEPASKFYSFNQHDFLYAVQLGRVQLLKIIVKRTGAGIPLDDLVKKSGVEITKKPKYYQGLSVHGKKRADWAAAGRDTQCDSSREEHPPLLHAARLTNLDSIEWFLSDAAIHCYTEFAENNEKDKRIQSLAQAKGGLQASINKWLSLRSQLLIHIVILSKTDEKSLDLLRYLCKRDPESIHHKSATGLTPLQLAFTLHRIEMAKILLEANADQTVRNHNSQNLIHSVLSSGFTSRENGRERLRELLRLIDSRLVSSMLKERTTAAPGAATPLAQWIYTVFRDNVYSHRYNNYDIIQQSKEVTDVQEETLRIILEFSKGEDLDLVNGEGDTPLHAVVRYGADHLLRIMLSCRPELLFRENASGRTPYEMAEDAHLARNVFKNPPTMGSQRQRYFNQNPTCKITERQPQTFVEGKKDMRSPTEKVWDVCREFKEKAARGTKRKLVSLLEANEVAKRLAAKKARIENDDGSPNGEENADEEKNKGDEVDVWFNMGLSGN